MEFYKKIDALLTLTSTTNAKIAAAINIDRSQISRMRTGARKRPRKNDIIRLIAKYFAKYCKDEYRLSALEKLTYDYRVHAGVSEDLLETIIFEWLCTDEDIQKMSSTERFLYQVEQFSANDFEAQTDFEKVGRNGTEQSGEYIIYYGNSGKRQAALDFFNIALSAKAVQRLLVSSDEPDEWVFEDSSFTKLIENASRLCVESGIVSTQIYTLSQDLDFALYTVRQWIWGYNKGNISQYYYPMHRDKLYRHTLMVIPKVAALCSASLGFKTESYMTVLTRIPDVVESYTKEFYDLLSFCKPMTTVYTAETEEKLFERLESLQAESKESIFKFSSLPTHTMPKAIMEHISSRENSHIANKAYENYKRGFKSREKSLEKYKSLDIIKLAPIEQVRAGRVEIPHTDLFSSHTYFYTADLYKQHLQFIADELENNENYDVIISEASDMDSLSICGIGTNTAIIVKSTEPFMVIEIDEPRFVCSFIEFLQDIAKKERKKTSRQQTLENLKEYIERI